MSKQLDDLTAEVAEVTTVEQSAITLINGIVAKLDAANGDAAKIEALTAQLRNSATTLAAAVAANTAPPSETPAPTPTPTP